MIDILILNEIIVIPKNLGCCHRNWLWRFSLDGVSEHEGSKLTWLCVATILCLVSLIQVVVVKNTGSTLSTGQLDKT